VIFFKFPTNWGYWLDTPPDEAENEMPCHILLLKTLKKDADLEMSPFSKRLAKITVLKIT